MKVCYSPYNKEAMDQNKYIFQVSKAIKSAGFDVVSMRDTFKNPRIFREVKIFNLNWYENIYDKSIIFANIHFIKKVMLIFLLKAFGKKIVWTMHNKIPHDNDNKKLCISLMKILIRKSNLIIIHCEDSKEEIYKLVNKNLEIDKKIINIKHPNYIDVYNNKIIDYRAKYKIKNDEIVFLFLGQVKPYKNIELIIQLADKFKLDKVRFIIAGKCNSNDYKDKLMKKIRFKNIIPILRFIDNEEMTSLINASDVIILPYDIESSLNSGTAILAFSYGKTVISPRIGTLNDLNSYSNLFTYTYTNEEEHLKELSQIVKNIVTSKEEKKQLKIKGEILLELMKSQYNLDIISMKYYEAFNSIIK